MSQRTVAAVLLLLLLLPVVGSIAPHTGPFFAGDPVPFDLAEPSTIRITDGAQVFRYTGAGADAIFTPHAPGTYDGEILDPETGETRETFTLTVLPPPVQIDARTVAVGATVTVAITPAPGNDRRVILTFPDGTEREHTPDESIAIITTLPGPYTITLEDATTGRAYTTGFLATDVSAQAPADDSAPPTPEQPSRIPTDNGTPDEQTRARLAARFPDVRIAHVMAHADGTRDVRADGSDGNHVELRGVPDSDTISRVAFHTATQLATDIVTVEGARVTGATITLAQHGPVGAIGRCDTTLPDGTCDAWIETGIPFTSNGTHVTFDVDHFTSYGGMNVTNRWYVTSAAPNTNQTPALASAQDAAANGFATAFAGGESGVLLSLINASRTTTGMVVRTTDVINFSTYWVTGSRITTVHATFKLAYGATGPSTVICQFGNDNTGGILIPTGASAMRNGTCSPSANVTVPNGTKLWYVVNAYVAAIGTGGTAATRTMNLTWDTATFDTWVNVRSYQRPDVNVTTNQTSYMRGTVANITGSFVWSNASAVPGNVTLQIINAIGSIVNATNITMTSTGAYQYAYMINQTVGTGTWSVNVTGIYNNSVNATNTTLFTVYEQPPAIVISDARANRTDPVPNGTVIRVNASVVNISAPMSVYLQIDSPLRAPFNTTPARNGDEWYNDSIFLNETGVWRFTFYANDTDGYATSANVTDAYGVWAIESIVAPVMLAASIAPASPTASDPLAGFCNATATNGRQLGYEYTWYVNGSIEAFNGTRFATNGIAAGGWTSCGIRANDSRVLCWGLNDQGQIGNNQTVDRNVPTLTNDTSGYRAVDTTESFSCGIRANDSRVLCWGYGQFGQLGHGLNGTGSSRSVPTLTVDESAYLTVSIGWNSPCGIRANDSRVLCWGENTKGQLGTGENGTPTNRNVPTLINDTSAYLAISSGRRYACGIRANDSRVLCWGDNNDGQLGIGERGTPTNRNSPTLINDTSAYLSVTAGDTHTCGIRANDSRVLCWGENFYGQLGTGENGTFTNRTTPTPITDTSPYLSVDLGTYQYGTYATCGIRANDSRVLCWGIYALLGNGATGFSQNANVSTLTNDTGAYSAVSVSGSHVCGIRTSDSAVRCWGGNALGELGNNQTGTGVSTPTFTNDTSPHLGGFSNYTAAQVALLTAPHAAGSNVTLQCTAFDGYSWSAPMNSSTVVIPAPPSIGSVSVAPSPAGNGTFVNISATITDIDGISAAIAQLSYPNGTAWQNLTMGGTGSTYNVTFTSPAAPLGNYTVTVFANDTLGANQTSAIAFIPFVRVQAKTTVTLDGAFTDWNTVVNLTDPLGDASAVQSATGPAFWRPFNISNASGMNMERSFDKDYNDTVRFSHLALTSAGSPCYQWINYTFDIWDGASEATLYLTTRTNDTAITANVSVYNTTDGTFTLLLNSFSTTTTTSVLPLTQHAINSTGGIVVRVCGDSNAQPTNLSVYDIHITTAGSTHDFAEVQNPSSTHNATRKEYTTTPSCPGGWCQDGEEFSTGPSTTTYQHVQYLEPGAENATTTGYLESGTGWENYHFKTSGTVTRLYGEWRGIEGANGQIPTVGIWNSTDWEPIPTVRSVPSNISGVKRTIAVFEKNASTVSQYIDANGYVHLLAQETDGVFIGDLTTDYVKINTNGSSAGAPLDIVAVAVANNNSHLYAKIQLNGSLDYSIASVYRVYMGKNNTAGNSTTPEGNGLPFAYQYRLQLNNSQCVVHNSTGSNVGSCGFANNTGTLELSVPFTTVNASLDTAMNLTFETVSSDARIDLAPNADSFIEFTPTVQDAGPPAGPYAPAIDNVTAIATVTPVAAANVTVFLNFTAHDADGVAELNDTTANFSVTNGTTTRTGACEPTDLNSTTARYNCSVALTHYDPAGTWRVNVSVSDTTWRNATDSTTTFIVDPLVAIALSPATLSFGTIAVGMTGGAATDPLVVDNRGNVNVTALNLTAFTLVNGSFSIDAGNVTANLTDELGTPLPNGTNVTLPGSWVNPDTDAGETSRSLYYYITIPNGTLPITFSAMRAWEVVTQ